MTVFLSALFKPTIVNYLLLGFAYQSVICWGH